MELTIHEKTWPYIDEFFRKVPEAMRKVPTFQEALEKSEKSGEQSGVRQTLLLVLRHKFEKIPEEIVQLIEVTGDREQLDRWLEQTLDADSLAEIAFDLGDEVGDKAN